jgi:hypothetical protein
VLSLGERGDLGRLRAAYQYWSGHVSTRLSLSGGCPHERVTLGR